MCNKRFFQLSEDWSLSVFEASVTRVSQSIGTIRVFGGQQKQANFGKKKKVFSCSSFVVFVHCCKPIAAKKGHFGHQ